MKNASKNKSREFNLKYDYGIDAFDEVPPCRAVHEALSKEPELKWVSELNLLKDNSLTPFDFLRVINAINERGQKLGFHVVFM